jgi:IMP dehydrogenase
MGAATATAEGAEALIKAGASAVKVGVGPGSICTTRVVTGVGVPQLTAVMDAVRVASRFDVPVISDGGVKFSGDAVKALAGGASTVMIGSLFAAPTRHPARRFYQAAPTSSTADGSLGALPTARATGIPGRRRSRQLEGIEGACLSPGLTSNVPAGGRLRSGMGYVGAADLAELRQKARFVRISQASLKESHVHDVVITKEAPNYRLE